MHSILYVSYNLFLHSTSLVCNHKGNHILEGGWCSHTNYSNIPVISVPRSLSNTMARISNSPGIPWLSWNTWSIERVCISHTRKILREEWGREPNTVSWLDFQLLFICMTKILYPLMQIMLLIVTSWNKQHKHWRHLYCHFTKRHRKAESWNIDLRSPRENQFSWESILLLNNKMAPLCHAFQSSTDKCQ